MTARGMVQTVLGPVAPADLGVTLPHEHLLIDLRPRFIEPATAEEQALARQPVGLANLGWARRNWLSSLDNLVLDDEAVAIDELRRFKRAGGGTVVDAGSIGIRPDPRALRRISEAAGLHVVAATGHYTQDFHSPDMPAMPEDALVEEIVRDVRDGIGATGVRAGIIGEVGCSSPLHPDERKALRAAARAQRATGAPITIHPGRSQASPFEILAVLDQAGADRTRVIMGHIERTELELGDLLRLAATGCYLEFDWFGEVQSLFPLGPLRVPSDIQRIEQLRTLVGEGHGDRLLASHDICLKTRLASCGGVGYAHILSTVTGWMRACGMSAADVGRIVADNPQRILAFV